MSLWAPSTEILENSMGLKDCNKITRRDEPLQYAGAVRRSHALINQKS
jgi:hypothetical protein